MRQFDWAIFVADAASVGPDAGSIRHEVHFLRWGPKTPCLSSADRAPQRTS